MASHPVRFAAGTTVSAGLYRNTHSGAVRYFDGHTPLPGGVNSASWQQVSDHYHARTRRTEAASVHASPTPLSPPPPSPRFTADDIAAELFSRLNAGDEEGAIGLFARDAHLYFPLDGILVCHRGPVQLRRLISWLHANLLQLTLRLDRLSGGGDTVTIDFAASGRTADGSIFDRAGAMYVETQRGRIDRAQIALARAA